MAHTVVVQRGIKFICTFAAPSVATPNSHSAFMTGTSKRPEDGLARWREQVPLVDHAGKPNAASLDFQLRMKHQGISVMFVSHFENGIETEDWPIKLGSPDYSDHSDPFRRKCCVKGRLPRRGYVRLEEAVSCGNAATAEAEIVPQGR
jgi:hypothetical protein